MYQTDEYTKPRVDCIMHQLPEDKSKRFSLVDWGSAEGVFALEIAHRHREADVISIESNEQPTFEKEKPTETQEKFKRGFQLHNLQIFEKKITKEFIEHINSASIKFDYQLLLNILHHFKMSNDEWRLFVSAYINLARVSFVSLPEKNELRRDTLWNVASLRTYYQGYETTYELLKSILPGAYVIDEIGQFDNYIKDDKRKIFRIQQKDIRWPIDSLFIRALKEL